METTDVPERNPNSVFDEHESGGHFDDIEETPAEAPTEAPAAGTAQEPEKKKEIPAAYQEEDTSASSAVPSKPKFNKVCPSVLKGEPCWALSRGKPCHYALHSRNGEPAPIEYPPPNSNVYVCHLPLATNKEQLEAMFAPYGEIRECKLLVEPKTQEPRGVAFVHFTTPAEARSAIEAIHGLMLPGHDKPLECRMAKPNVRSGTAPDMPGGGGRRPRGGGMGGRGSRYPPDGRGPPRGFDDYRRDPYDDYDRHAPRAIGYGPARSGREPRGPPGPYDRPPLRGPPRGPPGPRDGFDRYDPYAPPRNFGPPPPGRRDPYLEFDDYPPYPGPRGPPPPNGPPAFSTGSYDPYGTRKSEFTTTMPPIYGK